MERWESHVSTKISDTLLRIARQLPRVRVARREAGKMVEDLPEFDGELSLPTSDEIFAWVEAFCRTPHRRPGTPEGHRAEQWVADRFRELGLEKTKERNCVLILFIVTNREFLIHGDQGIHERVGQRFWDDIRDKMVAAFEKDEFGEGISQGVCLIGERLSQYFPYQRDDTDEISNEIVYKN